MKKLINQLMKVNTILLGLLMLVPGLLKLFVSTASGVSEMLSMIFLFSWAPMFWSWVLIIGEIGSGLAILSGWKLDKISYIPAFILTIAALTVIIRWSSISQTNWNLLIFHFIAIVNYMILAIRTKK
jgi:uncharacterized membrane protein YphA (DoxX/SURF4 family)